MKIKHYLLVSLALFFSAFCFGQTPTRTITVSPGDRVEVRGSSDDSSSVGRTFLKDVVRALEILNRYSPEEYRPSPYTFTTTSSGLTIGYYTNSPKTKADEMREEARRLKAQSDEKKSDADKFEKEIEEVKWARGILQKLKDRLE